MALYGMIHIVGENEVLACYWLTRLNGGWVFIHDMPPQNGRPLIRDTNLGPQQMKLNKSAHDHR